MKKLIIIFSGLLLFSPVFAQGNDNKENEFTLGAQLRSRAEYRNGTLNPHADEADPAAFINNRSRLSMEYKRSKLSLGLSAQNVGVWGQDPQIDNNGRFMLNEAWASINPGNGFFMKLGRQSLVYDDDRILGSLDWNVSGRHHDAMKLGFENVQNKLHLILAFNQTGEGTSGTYYPMLTQTVRQPYKTMQTLWYQHIADKTFNASFLLMNLGMDAGDATKSDVKYLQTLGTNLSFQPNNFQLYGTFYFQTGKNVTRAAADKSVSAYMWAINASYSVNPALKLMVASDYLSGDDGEDAGKYKAFDPLYGTHHKFYGTMDYFYASTFMAKGLWDNQLGISYKTSPKITLALNYHHFQTATNVSVGEKKQKTLGSEWDFQLTWNVMKDVTLTGGYSTMFGNDAMKAVKGGDPSKWQDWMWVSLNINPKVFITKW